MAMPILRKPPCANLIKRQPQASNRVLGRRDFRRRHLCKILFLQYFAVGEGQSCINFDFRLILCALVESGKQSFLNALCAGGGRFRRRPQGLRNYRCNKFFDVPAFPEEDSKCLIEENCMFMPFYEYGMQRPVKIVACANACDAQRFKGVKHGTWPDRNPSRTQGSREVDYVFCKTTFGRGHAVTPPPL